MFLPRLSAFGNLCLPGLPDCQHHKLKYESNGNPYPLKDVGSCTSFGYTSICASFQREGEADPESSTEAINMHTRSLWLLIILLFARHVLAASFPPACCSVD